MTTQTKLNLSLAPGREGQRQKAILQWLAHELDLRSVSDLNQRIAQAADTSPFAFAAAMERAFAVAAGVEDEGAVK